MAQQLRRPRGVSNDRVHRRFNAGNQHRERSMNDITRRDALALGASAAALAVTAASAQTASPIKAADVPAPKLAIDKGASLSMLRPVRFVQADEDVFRPT